MAEQKTPVLETRKLGISFGGLKAVQDFNLQMYQGELVGLIGPNGAGKTTVFNLLTGVYVPTEGTVLLDGTPLNGKKTHQFVAAGMNPTETAELLECINTIRDRFGIAILLIEHDMSLVMNVCQRIQVIDYGQTIATGLPEEIAANPRVIAAYLGE